MHVSINRVNEYDFEFVKQHIHLFELDNRELHSNEFLVATYNNKIVGFGRIRNHESCCELCSLGIIEAERLKGIGKRLVSELIKQSYKPLYLVCIIPTFFEPFNFSIVNEYPVELTNKLNYCTSELCVPEKYVVMKYNKSSESF